MHFTHWSVLLNSIFFSLTLTLTLIRSPFFTCIDFLYKLYIMWLIVQPVSGKHLYDIHSLYLKRVNFGMFCRFYKILKRKICNDTNDSKRQKMRMGIWEWQKVLANTFKSGMHKNSARVIWIYVCMLLILCWWKCICVLLLNDAFDKMYKLKVFDNFVFCFLFSQHLFRRSLPNRSLLLKCCGRFKSFSQVKIFAAI